MAKCKVLGCTNNANSRGNDFMKKALNLKNGHRVCSQCADLFDSAKKLDEEYKKRVFEQLESERKNIENRISRFKIYMELAR